MLGCGIIARNIAPVLVSVARIKKIATFAGVIGKVGILSFGEAQNAVYRLEIMAVGRRQSELEYWQAITKAG